MGTPADLVAAGSTLTAEPLAAYVSACPVGGEIGGPVPSRNREAPAREPVLD